MTRRRAKKRALLAGTPLLFASGMFVLAAFFLTGFAAVGLGVAASLAVLGILIMRRPNDGIPALMFHSVSSDADWLPWHSSISIRPETFRTQLRMLERLGYTALGTRQYLDARLKGAPMPGRAVMLHFDDGYLDNWVAVSPLLKAQSMCGTIFISTNFVDSTTDQRPQLNTGGDPDALEWAGYMNWSELRALDASPHIEIEAHGVDHARVETSDDVVDRLTPRNWKRYAWREWSGLQGNKSRWFEAETPNTVALGSPIHSNDSALVAQAISEPDTQALQHRWAQTAETVQAVFEHELGHPARLFCWPFNRWTDDSHAAMLSHGFEATTASENQNRSEDDPRRIARIHVQERAFGVRSPTLDAIYMVATIETFRGRYYWALLTTLANVLRRVRYGPRTAPAS